VFTPFHKPPYTYPYGRSVDETTTLDDVGKFPKSVGGYAYLLVAIDMFTKWVEVELVRALTAQATVKFIQGIVCHFGVPNRIIT
jgi:transposase-like protein